MTASLDMIIINYNSGNYLRNCLESVAKAKRDVFKLSQIVVVDNASSDGSVGGLEDLNLPLTLIRNTKNLGFAKACNQGAKGSKADYLLFLNPDTYLYENSLEEPLAFMERPENMGVGICGIQLLDESGRVALSCARFPSLGIFLAQALGLEKVLGQSFLEYRMSESEHSITRDVDQVIGAFFVVRRRVFEVLGGFDERFFVYFEEVDFSLRAHKAGWRSVFLSDAHACHVGGGTSRQVKAARLFYSLRSRLLYGFKHYSPIKAWALFLITLAVEPWSRILFSLLKGSWPGARHTIKGYRMLTKDTPSILKVAIGMQSELD